MQPSGVALNGGSAPGTTGESQNISAHTPSPPTSVGSGGGAAAGAGGDENTASKGGSVDGTEGVLASDWCRKAQEDQQRAVALQAAKLVVVSSGGTILCPAVWDAGTPWWRQAETPRMV